MLAPTGRQFEIHRGSQTAVMVECGGGIREYTVAERPIIDGYPSTAPVTGSRGMPLLPWPNRIQDGRYAFGGVEFQLPINQVEEHHAIHGLTRWLPWTPIDHTSSRVTLGTTIFPQPGYAGTLVLRIAYLLTENGLAVHTEARNAGAQALPYGAGHHPYLAPGGGRVDSAILSVPASRRLAVDPRSIPTGEEVDVAGTVYDFRRPRPVADLRLDTCYSGLERDPDGLARVRFDGTTLWMDRSYSFLMLFTGDTLPDPAERRRGLAVEPMTCPPNAFQSGTGVITLAPGESVTSSWGFQV
jgi:aldose 1-epimerase